MALVEVVAVPSLLESEGSTMGGFCLFRSGGMRVVGSHPSPEDCEEGRGGRAAA